MIFNYILYLIIPWIFGIILYRKDSRTFLTIFPFGSIISLMINIWGIYMGYWNIYLTFVIFLAAYLLGYMYYILLRRKEIVV